jgi:hypothetical protein
VLLASLATLYSLCPFPLGAHAVQSSSLTFESEGEAVSADGRDLIVQLMSPDPQRRLGAGPDIEAGFAAIRRHPFFNGVDFASLANRAPPFPPHLSSPEDHSRFDMDTGSLPAPVALARRDTRANFSGEDLPFVGFSFTLSASVSGQPPAPTSGFSRQGTIHSHPSTSHLPPPTPLSPSPALLPTPPGPQMAATKADVELAETQAKLKATMELSDKYWQEVLTLRDRIEHIELDEKSRYKYVCA